MLQLWPPIISGGARNLRLDMPNIEKKLKLIRNIVDDKLHNKSIIAPFGCCYSCHRHFALPQHAVATAKRCGTVRIIIGCGLLRTDAGVLALGRRGACGLPLPELPLPSWGGHQDERAGCRSPECRQTPIQGIGGGPRAEGEGLKAEGRRRTGANAEPGGRGLRASYEQRRRE